MSGLSPARRVASRALVRVWRDRAFVAAALDAELAASGMSDRDAALATELVYGVLRVMPFLLDTLQQVSNKPVRFADDVVRAHVLMAAYTLWFLDRIPRFAAVNEAVTGVSGARYAHTVGLVNALLRRLSTRVDQTNPRPSLGDAVERSCAPWLRSRIAAALGAEGAAAFLRAGPWPPPLTLCAAANEDRAAIVAELRASQPDAHVEEGRISPRAVLISGAGDLRKLPGVGARFIAQDEGAQIVALALGARSGERVLDACAGRGTKCWILREAVGPSGQVDAADLHANKLALLAETPYFKGARGGGADGDRSPERPSGIRTFVCDWRSAPERVPTGYDRVLVDAPCTGTGTLRRRPEIALTRTADNVKALAAAQIAIVRGAATRVRPGGRLVFAVCSVLREEAEDVERALTEEIPGAPQLVPEPFDSEPAKTLAAGSSSFRVLPHVHGTDGFFVASFVVRGTPR